jgi:hypothetical protein
MLICSQGVLVRNVYNVTNLAYYQVWDVSSVVPQLQPSDQDKVG